MGVYLYDQFSLLHFAVGVVAYFWGFSLVFTTLVHILFEIVENTRQGIDFINYYLKAWPGGKPYPDSIENCVADTIFTAAGWLASYVADVYSEQHHLYPSAANYRLAQKL